MAQTAVQDSAEDLRKLDLSSKDEVESAVDSKHDSSTKVLFQPFQVGECKVAHRCVYAPLTRCRALVDGEMRPSANEYYSQRVEPGTLLISEATVIGPKAIGYPCVPGIYTERQIEAWKPIVKAVHDKGGIFFLQLWHAGRASHREYQPNEELPISSSDVAISEAFPVYLAKSNKMTSYEKPRPLELSEIPGIVEEYVQGARNAIAAGFDGVEIHGANGYLLDQFLKDRVNKRTDEYGGSIENRCRLSLEVTKAVAEAVGAKRVGHRISPFSPFMDALDSNPIPLSTYLSEQLSALGIAYLHGISARVGDSNNDVEADLEKFSMQPFRKAFKGAFIEAGGFTPASAATEVAAGNTDLVAFGRWWLANPDFLQRVREGAPLNKYDRSTFYTQDEVLGYLDYPFLKDQEGKPTEKHYSGVTVYN